MSVPQQLLRKQHLVFIQCNNIYNCYKIKIRGYTALLPPPFSLMNRILLGAAAALLLTGAATAVWLANQPAVPAGEFAQCAAARLSGAERTRLGETASVDAEGGLVRLRRFDYLGCRGASGVFASRAVMTGQGRALAQLLAATPEYRRGLQSAAWGRAGYHGTARSTLTELTLLSAQQAVQRAWGQSCSRLTEGQAAELRDIEPALLTAVAGYQGWAGTAAQARQLAEQMLDQAKYHAVASANAAAASCTDAGMAAGLARQQQAAGHFLAGLHPLAPGCKVVLEQGDYVLACTAPAK
jgi:hypothetical protein